MTLIYRFIICVYAIMCHIQSSKFSGSYDSFPTKIEIKNANILSKIFYLPITIIFNVNIQNFQMKIS